MKMKKSLYTVLALSTIAMAANEDIGELKAQMNELAKKIEKIEQEKQKGDTFSNQKRCNLK